MAGAVETHCGDIASFESLQNVFRKCGSQPFDAIVHCAGRASDVGLRQAFKRTNFESVKHLARLTQATGAKRFVFVSSRDVYGMRDSNGEAEDELDLESNPVTPYPEFKIEAEKWLASKLPSDLHAIVRPAAVWGKGDLTITQRVVDFLRASPWIIHFAKWKGANLWPLAHVRNVAAAVYLLASDPQCAGRAVNVLGSEKVSIDDFYRMVAQTFFPSKTFGSITIPLSLASPVARLITFVSNLFGLARPFADPSHYALLSVSSNLNFRNQRFLNLMQRAGRRPVTQSGGMAEF